MGRILTALLLVALLAPEAVCADTAEEAAAVFDRLYGDALQKARATRDPADDVELAGRLVEAAQVAQGQPAFAARLYEAAAELASGHPDGYDLAVEAARALEGLDPARAPECRETVLEIRQRQYDMARGLARADAGAALVDALVAAAEARKAARDYVETATLYRRAQGIARAIRSDRVDALQAEAAALADKLRVARRIDMLQRQLETDPSNQAARKELVELCLVDFDSPGKAAVYVEGLEDRQLATYVQAAARGVEAAPELACTTMAEWYRGLADKASDTAKGPMLLRARAYLVRFLELHKAEDLDRTQAALTLKQVETAMAELGTQAAPGRDGPSPLIGKWLNALALVDPTKDTLNGRFEFEGTHLESRSRYGKLLAVPIEPEGDYEVEIAFMPTGNHFKGVGLGLPVTDGLAVLQFDVGNTGACGLDMLNGKPADANESTVKLAPLQKGQNPSFLVSVRHVGENVAITVTHAGRKLIDWSGPPSSFAAKRGWTDCKSLGIGSGGGGFSITALKFKLLSGQAYASRDLPHDVPGLKPRPLRQPFSKTRPPGARDGLQAAYFEFHGGVSCAGLRSLKPYRMGVVPQVYFAGNAGGNTVGSGRGQHVGAVFSGLVYAPKDGNYAFYLTCDDGGMVYLGEDVLVDADGNGASREREGKVRLAAGWHPVRVEYFQGVGAAVLMLKYVGPDITKQNVPADGFCHVPPRR